MTPKEKARSLCWEFAYKIDIMHDGNRPGRQAKECALIMVNQLIQSTQPKSILPKAHNPESTLEYWYDVKSEIEKI